MGKNTLTHLARLDTRSLGGAVLESLAEMVHRAGLDVGERLPPETQIAQQLGVGRSTVREALNRWEGIGLIRRKRGVGTFIAAPIPLPGHGVDADTQLDGDGILRLLEVRRSLEITMARLAAERATDQHRENIEHLCEDLLGVVAAGNPYREADVAFHAAIAEASANPIFGELLAALDQLVQKSQESPFDRPGFGRNSFPFHRDLADAIIACDPDGAERAVVQIISSVENEVRAMIASTPGAD